MSKELASRPLPVFICLLAALILTIVPLPDWAATYRPDWVALTLIYWSMASPRSYSVGTAWLFGLILDVAQGALLGQHALALTIVIYMTSKFHLQLRVFPLSQLTGTVFILLVLYQFMLFWINGIAGIRASADTYWGPVVAGTLIWPILALFFGGIRYRSTESS